MNLLYFSLKMDMRSNGHISTGQDFFTYDYGDYDIVISNPPFSLKHRVFERLFMINKPFAMVMSLWALNYTVIAYKFVHNPIQLLCFNKKVSYDGNISPFASGYICRDFLSSDLIFEHLPHNNTGRNFSPSRMYNHSQLQATTRKLI